MEVLMPLPHEVRVLPGHTDETTIGREWERKFFSRAPQYPLFEQLAKKIGEGINDGQTNGVWSFDKQKADAAKSPFHPDVVPPIYERK